ncbi:uracil-DNA glycosylase [Trichlorobacter ammonificans]|uniref:Type-4 uracil-DNA glycosylase n=1 Tax=Trichlorobacter ammonificans TaxID=2916410 RepID=A0ABN8HEX6_9BACT|nr:uracil-DNA glycosylase [Trichlorobacter ammonificans]CAH2029950.1 Type-4 uracil-DNA glycosylase [Trichlorobacter ammonificans]
MTTGSVDDLSLSALYASLREYLQELAETGVEGIPAQEPAETTPHREPAVAAASAGTATTLDEVRQQLGDCQRCGLAAGRTTLVFGSGNPQAELVFVGEAPGADEDRQGQPFVGEAGQILTRIITAMGLTRDDVYICNVLKCRPPGNRNPQQAEIDLCAPFLLEQLRVIRPKALVALGTFAAQTLLDSKEPISRLRGRFHDFHGIPLMPTFHPSFLLRNRTDKQRYWEVWEDMVQVLKLLGLPIPEKQSGSGTR